MRPSALLRGLHRRINCLHLVQAEAGGGWGEVPGPQGDVGGFWELALGAGEKGAGIAAGDDRTDNGRFAAAGPAGLHEGEAQLGGHRHLIPRRPLLRVLAVVRVRAAQPILLHLHPWLPVAEAQAWKLPMLG